MMSISPRWLRTAPLPKKSGSNYYLNHGLAPVPNDWLADTTLPRNVILIAGNDTDPFLASIQDRLFVFQDI